MLKRIFVFAIFISAFPLYAEDRKVLFLPYFSADLLSYSSSLVSDLKKESKWQIVETAQGSAPPEFPAEGFASESFIKSISQLGKVSSADIILACSLSKQDAVIRIIINLVSVSNVKSIYTTTLFVYPEDKDFKASFDILGRIRLFEEKKTFPVNNLSATMGSSASNTAITWDPVPECSTYGIYRARKKDGLYLPAGLANTNSFKDTTADPGVKYFYSIAPYYNGIRTEYCDSIPGYRKPPVPKDEDFKKLVESFTKPRPVLKGDDLQKAERHISMIKEIYQNRTKLQLILYIAKGYIDKKELYVYRGFSNFSIDRTKRVINIEADNRQYELFFNNNTFFNRIAAQGDEELDQILIRNAVFLCVPSGEKEHQLENGESVFVPLLEVASICTQYFKDCKEWPDTTLIFATSNKNLRSKMEDAKKKSEEPE
jgi:hypothetical protein